MMSTDKTILKEFILAYVEQVDTAATLSKVVILVVKKDLSYFLSGSKQQDLYHEDI